MQSRVVPGQGYRAEQSGAGAEFSLCFPLDFSPSLSLFLSFLLSLSWQRRKGAGRVTERNDPDLSLFFSLSSLSLQLEVWEGVGYNTLAQLSGKRPRLERYRHIWSYMTQTALPLFPSLSLSGEEGAGKGGREERGRRLGQCRSTAAI
jgi:hypothetical protein